MEDYTRYRLKKEEQIIRLLEKEDDLFVIVCKKCFKEFSGDDEPEGGEFLKYAASQGKSIAGRMDMDFLCNKTLTAHKLEDGVPPDARCIFAISCGLGVQTVAGLSELPVYAAADSISFEGRHGMALTTKLCQACAQCYLELTGGVCPIADCSKSLINGQCGGCKKGKCETDVEKDCAWEKIYERLSLQGRTGIMSGQPVQLRDFSKAGFDQVDKYVRAIREKRLDGYYGGLHPPEEKEPGERLPLCHFPSPKTVVIPLSQHAGAPAQPLVAKGDKVKLGQKIGEAGGFISSSVHASVSGAVIDVCPRRHPTTGLDTMSVVIESDGKDELHETVKPCGDVDSLSADEIVAIVRDKGIIGMGGAGFPTAVKLTSPKPIDTVLVNGCECEPFLTADHRVMLEYPDDVLFGLKAVMKATGATKGLIAIEDNKPDAITLLGSMTAETTGVEVLPVRTKYPQGAEKMLIMRALGRKVPGGGLPLDVGVVVSNVSTVKAISDAVQKGLPPIERVVSVAGKIKNHKNLIVRIGAPVSEIIDYCGGTTDSDVVIKLGGPMMGIGVDDTNIPVIKGTNGIIALETTASEASNCIRCGRCSDVCPMELLPLYYAQYAGKEDWEGMASMSVKDCIECACCQFICPSKIAITETIKAGKKAIAALKATAG